MTWETNQTLHFAPHDFCEFWLFCFLTVTSVLLRDLVLSESLVPPGSFLSQLVSSFLSEQEKSRDISIQYESTDEDCNSVESITLINVDNAQDTSTISFSKKTEESKTIIITPNIGTFNGKYLLQTNYKQSSGLASRLSTTTLFFYEKDLILKNSDVLIINKINLQNVLIQLSNKNISRHQT